MRAKTQEAEVEQADFDIIATDLRFVVGVFVVKGELCHSELSQESEESMNKKRFPSY